MLGHAWLKYAVAALNTVGCSSDKAKCCAILRLSACFFPNSCVFMLSFSRMSNKANISKLNLDIRQSRTFM